ncbi:MAG: amino acid adenylation domain-containing protein, partial [bacterium]|nr:amino acid adenylation domain-containing protein [bacterium]
NKTIKDKQETIKDKESAIREKTSSTQHPASSPASSIQHPASSIPSTPSTKSIHLTYRQLEQKADKIAARLIQEGAQTGDIVAIMVDRSIEMVAGVLGILKAGAVYMPVNPAYPTARKNYMLSDSTARIMLTTREKANEKAIQSSTQPLTWIYLEEQDAEKREQSQTEPPTQPITPAYVIYTSGTTGIPKGVVVTHKNVIRLVKNTNYIDIQPCNRLLQTGALEFDASTFEIWGTLLNGAGLVLVDKGTILDQLKLKKVITATSIDIMWMTSPMFNQIEEIELFATLKTLLVGGDVLSPPHIKRVLQAYPALLIINGYGPTENTTFSTTHLITTVEGNKRIPIGGPIANSHAYIIDKNYNHVPIGVSGELVVGGDGIALGYLNNPELTAERFANNKLQATKYKQTTKNKKQETKDNFLPPNNQAPITNTQLSPSFPNNQYPITNNYLYHTGDLCRWNPDGTIDFLGRIDRQVKVRGFRIELGEIENRLLQHEDVKEVVVIDREDIAGDKYLCAYVVTPQPGAIPQLREYLTGKLPDYMVPAYFIPIEAVPLNQNGKVEFKALPEPETGTTGIHYTAPRDDLEKKLVCIWAEILNREKETIGINDNFFEQGGHSLKATTLMTAIYKETEAKLSLEEIFEALTVKQLAHIIRKKKKTEYKSIEQAAQREYYHLSSSQKRLYILQQIDENNTGYNMVDMVKLEGELDSERLQNTFRKLIARHESLRTSFTIIEGEPLQKIEKKVHFEIEARGKTETGKKEPEVEQKVAQFIRPFRLSEAPLLRVGLIETVEKNRH